MAALIRKINNLSIDRVSLALTLIYSIIIIIISNFGDPLYYDEAWRADLIRRGTFSLAYSHAPVAYAYYLVIRFFDLFSVTNFSQRLLNYVALLVLPFVVYKFCLIYFDKNFARVMIILTFISGYIIENASMAKPYLLDIVCTLVLIIAYRKYVECKLKPIYFIILSVLISLLSFASFFILPALALLLFYRYFKHKSLSLWWLIGWCASWSIASLVQLLVFIKPQKEGC